MLKKILAESERLVKSSRCGQLPMPRELTRNYISSSPPKIEVYWTDLSSTSSPASLGFCITTHTRLASGRDIFQDDLQPIAKVQFGLPGKLRRYGYTFNMFITYESSVKVVISPSHFAKAVLKLAWD
jgi:hypothetical protein